MREVGLEAPASSSDRATLEAELLGLFTPPPPVEPPSSDHPWPPLSDDRFNSLALRIFRHQYEYGPVLRAFWERRGATPETVRHWTDIPGIPTAAFKEAPLCAFSTTEAAAIFETSGTTAGGRSGRHYLRTLALYEASLLPAFEAFVLPERRPMRMLNLGPNAEAMPHSSLGHMLSLVIDRWGQERSEVKKDGGAQRGEQERSDAGGRAAGAAFAPRRGFDPARGGSAHFVTASGPDLEGFRTALRAAEREGVPVCLLGTAFGFIHWLDTFPADRFRLAPGSRLMDTGGTKGRTREMAPAVLYAAYSKAFGIPEDRIVNEYGMTELSSQYYDIVLRTGRGRVHPRPKQGPPWLRTLVVDPETLRPLPEGEVGLLLHIDLANLDSVLAVQTDDMGRLTLDGLVHLGRATGAEARGCSLAAEELMRAIGAL